MRIMPWVFASIETFHLFYRCFCKRSCFALFPQRTLQDLSVSAFFTGRNFLPNRHLSIVRKCLFFFVGSFHVASSLTWDKWESLARACSLSLSMVSYSGLWSINQMIMNLVVLGGSLTITGHSLCFCCVFSSSLDFKVTWSNFIFTFG